MSYCFLRSSVKFQGHTVKKNRQFLPKLGFLGCYSSWNSNCYEMVQKAWSRIEEVPYRVSQSCEIYSNLVPLSPPHWPYPKRIRPPSWPRVAVASSIQNTKLFTWRTWPGASAVPKCDWAAWSQCGGSKQRCADHTKYIWYVATRGQSVITTELMIA